MNYSITHYLYVNVFRKYLREPEREQLSRQALSLTLQTLRARLRDEPTSALVLEMFRTYQTVQKLLPQKEKTFASLLIEAYKKHKKVFFSFINLKKVHFQYCFILCHIIKKFQSISVNIFL